MNFDPENPIEQHYVDRTETPYMIRWLIKEWWNKLEYPFLVAAAIRLVMFLSLLTAIIWIVYTGMAEFPPPRDPFTQSNAHAASAWIQKIPDMTNRF